MIQTLKKKTIIVVVSFDRTMAEIILISRLHVFIFIVFNLSLIFLFLLQFCASLWNIVKHFCRTKLTNQRPIFNLYLFNHLIVCLFRCLLIFLSNFSLLLFRHCVPIEVFIHFLLLISTFDLLLIIIGETAHFWDSTISSHSSLYSKCCLAFGMILNYFVAGLFLSLHLIMHGENLILVEFCQLTNRTFVTEQSLVPTLITYVLFILINLLTCSWIYLSYRDIRDLKHKRLATMFFHSLIFTKLKRNERLTMVNRSLKRLLAISLFVLSNILSTLPMLTLRLSQFTIDYRLRIVLIYFTVLPWLDCLTLFFYDEMKFNGIKIFSKRMISSEYFYRQQRIGRRLSSYQESVGRV